MDAVSVAAAVVSGLVPFLPEIAKGAAQELGKRGVDAAQRVWAWCREQLAPAGQDALDKLSSAPDDEDLQAMLRVHLRELLSAHPDRLPEVTRLLEALPDGGVSGQRMEQHGKQQRGVQIQGDDNLVDMG